MKILPAAQVLRPRERESRASRHAAARATASPEVVRPRAKAAPVRAYDALLLRLAADRAFAVDSAAPYVAQQIGQILETEGSRQAPFGGREADAYRRAGAARGAAGFRSRSLLA